MTTAEPPQHKITRVRRDQRVRIGWPVFGDQTTELPFVVGVMADLSADGAADLPPYRDRRFIYIDRDNFNDVLRKAAPVLRFAVPDRLAGSGDRRVELRFRHLDDFRPDRVAAQLPGVRAVLPDGDPAAAAQLDAVLHHPKFQRLEATWRGLHYLVDRTETGVWLKLRVLNATKKEVGKDLGEVVEFDQSTLFKKVCVPEVGVLGPSYPYGMLVGDYEFSAGPDDVAFLRSMSRVAAASHAPFVAAASPAMFGFERMTELANPRDMAKIFDRAGYDGWKAFRDTDESRYVALTVPRVLGRLPYGADFNPVAGFDYEEQVDGPDHSKYLWMSAAWAYAARVTDAFARDGWFARTRGVEGGGKVEGLPVHTFPTDDGDVAMKCPAEIAITDRREMELSHLGFLPLMYVKERGSAAFLGTQTCQKPKTYFDPASSASAELSAKLNYILCTSRFAHAVVVFARNAVAAGGDDAELQRRISDWLAGYVGPAPEYEEDGDPARPLSSAEATVEPGGREVVLSLRLAFHLDVSIPTLRLRVALPPAGGRG